MWKKDLNLASWSLHYHVSHNVLVSNNYIYNLTSCHAKVTLINFIHSHRDKEDNGTGTTIIRQLMTDFKSRIIVIFMCSVWHLNAASLKEAYCLIPITSYSMCACVRVCMRAWRRSTLSAAVILLRAETVCITSRSRLSFTVIYGKTRSVWIKEMMPRQEKEEKAWIISQTMKEGPKDKQINGSLDDIRL